MTKFHFGVLAAGLLATATPVAAQQGQFQAGPPGLDLERDVASTYIIQFNDKIAVEDIDGFAHALAARFNGQVRNVYEHTIHGFAVTMSDVALNRLLAEAGDFQIRSVEQDGIVTVSLPQIKKGGPPANKGPNKDSGGTCAETLPWGVARVTGWTQDPYESGGDGCTVHTGNDTVDYSGSNLRVCVIDTGVNAHPDLNLQGYVANFTTEANDDLNGHGTHVAGTIGAVFGNGQGVIGVAPNAPIYAIKVLNRRGSGRYKDVIDGVDASVGNCDVANMSLGGGFNSSLNAAVQAAALAGVKYALAAGNSAVDTDGYSPASASGSDGDDIFTIAAFGEGNVWAYFSNFNDDWNASGQVPPLVDFAMPGMNVLSTVPGGYAAYNGTSMASPHMAGILARYLTPTGLGTVPALNRSFATNGTISRNASELYPVAVD